MIGTACPSLSTSRSLLGFHGSFGSHRIWWYSRTVTKWASDKAVDGCPLPADVVISTDSFPSSTAFLLAACSKLMRVTPMHVRGFAEEGFGGSPYAATLAGFAHPGNSGRFPRNAMRG